MVRVTSSASPTASGQTNSNSRTPQTGQPADENPSPSRQPHPPRKKPVTNTGLGVGVLASMATTGGGRAHSGANSARSSLFGMARSYRTAGLSSVSVRPNRETTMSAGASGFYGSVGVGGNVFSEEHASSFGANASLSRNGLSTSAKITTASGQKIGASSFLKSGYLSLGINATIDLEEKFAWADKDGAAMNVGGYVSGWKNYIGVGGNIGVALPTASIKIGANLSVSADRTVRYLGEYKGDEPQLHDHHGVEIELSNGTTVGGAVAVSNGMFGVGGRLSARNSKSVVYRTFLPEDDVHGIVSEQNQPDFLAQKAEALAMQSQALPIPNLADPESLRVGDELVVQTTGMVKGGVLLGGLGPAVSVNGHLEGSFQVSARRIDDTHIELMVSPRNVKGVGIGASVPLVHAEANHSLALAMRQAFVFDISNPQALQSYRRALNGTLPCNMQSPNAVAENDDGRLLAAMNCEVLPEGVSRTFLEKVELPMTSVGVSTGLRFLPEEAGVSGLAYYHISARKKQVITDGVTALTLQTKGLEDQWELLWSGKEARAVSATLYRKSIHEGVGKYTRDFDKMSLKARMSDSQIIGNECNDKIVAPLNAAFGTTVGEFCRPGHKQSREVKLEQILTAEDFQVLAGFTPAKLRAISNQSGADIGALTNLVASLETEYNPWDQARFIQDFVSKEGLSGFGAIHQMLADPERLNVTTTSDSYSNPLKEAKEIMFEYQESVQPWQDKRLLNRRFSRVYEAIDSIKEGLRDLEDDALMREFEPEQYEFNKASLNSVRRDLGKLIGMEHLQPLQRQRVYSKLESKSLFHRVDLLGGQYENQIHSTESKAEIKQRFLRVDPVLEKVENELRKIQQDTALLELDHSNQSEYQECLLAARVKLQGLLSFSHLSDLERGSIYRKFEEPSGCIPSSRTAVSRKIMGILIGEGTDFPEFGSI